MAFDISSPLAGLAWDMATRAAEAQKKAKSQYDYERDLVNRRLTPYGGDISEYDKEWERVYGPASQAGQAQGQAWQKYWTGLPEIMSAAAKEGTASASAGASAYRPPQTSTLDWESLSALLGIEGPTQARYGTADTAERSILTPRRAPVRRGPFGVTVQ